MLKIQQACLECSLKLKNVSENTKKGGKEDEWEIECIDSSRRRFYAVPLHNITTQMKGFEKPARQI